MIIQNKLFKKIYFKLYYRKLIKIKLISLLNKLKKNYLFVKDFNDIFFDQIIMIVIIAKEKVNQGITDSLIYSILTVNEFNVIFNL